ncbi:MAG: hypothetical protein ACOCVH_02010 [Verrucomicrobiota bacterium]
MFKAKYAKEITIEVGNEIGVLQQVSKIVAEKGINIVSIDGDVKNGTAVLRILTDDNTRAVEALQANRYNAVETDTVILELPHKPGLLKSVTERLGRAQIDIKHIAATAPMDQEKCLLVLSTSDDQEAVVQLNKD